MFTRIKSVAYYVLGDSITIVRQLYNKYRPTLYDHYLPETEFKKSFSNNYRFKFDD